MERAEVTSRGRSLHQLRTSAYFLIFVSEVIQVTEQAFRSHLLRFLVYLGSLEYLYKFQKSQRLHSSSSEQLGILPIMSDPSLDFQEPTTGSSYGSVLGCINESF